MALNIMGVKSTFHCMEGMTGKLRLLVVSLTCPKFSWLRWT